MNWKLNIRRRGNNNISAYVRKLLQNSLRKESIMCLITLLSVIFISQSLLATESVGPSIIKNGSYRGIKIGISAPEASKILKSLESTEHPDERDSSCYYLQTPDKQDKGLAFMIVDGLVARIDVYENKKVSTEKGIRIGSTKADVMASYKNVRVSPHPYLGGAGEYLEAKLTEKIGIIFETEKDIVSSFRLGDDSIHFIEGCS